MGTATQTKGPAPFDGVLEYTSDIYSFEAWPIKNTHIAAVTITKANLIGMPVLFNTTNNQVELVAAATINTINAVILEATGDVTALASGAVSAVKATIAARGPVVLRTSLIKLLDAAGAAITLATVKTALRACNPSILLAAEPTTVVKQAS